MSRQNKPKLDAYISVDAANQDLGSTGEGSNAKGSIRKSFKTVSFHCFSVPVEHALIVRNRSVARSLRKAPLHESLGTCGNDFISTRYFVNALNRLYN